MMIEGRVLMPEDRILDLTDPLQEGETAAAEELRPGWPPPPEKIYDLVDAVERRPKMAFVDPGLREEIMKRATEIAEKVAREIVPDIAERVIREEIEKLKQAP